MYQDFLRLFHDLTGLSLPQPHGWLLLLVILALSLLTVAAGLWSSRRALAASQQALFSETAALEHTRSELAAAHASLADLQSTLVAERQSKWESDKELAVAESQLTSLEEINQTLRQSLVEQQRSFSTVNDARQQAENEVARLQVALEKDQSHHDERLRLLDEARQNMSAEFQRLAGQVMQATSSQFRERSQQELEQTLKPLQFQLKEFRQKVEDVYDKEAQQRFSLSSEVKKLQQLNSRLSEDAESLTNALKGDNKIAGNWGEMVLESLLEKSGLRKGEEYQTQVSLRSGEGRRQQPDVIVQLPENRAIIVDSKVSLVAYENYHRAQDDEARLDAMQRHLASLRKHVKDLSGKGYEQLLDNAALDFVLMFVPIESAFVAAVEQAPDLISEAQRLNIVIVSPTTLMATLRTVANVWRFEQQSRNTQEIIRQAGNLYDKFANFVGDLQLVGQRIQQAQQAHEQAFGRLSQGRGNLLSRIEKLRQLGARASKPLPAELVDSDTAEVAEAPHENG